MANKKLFGGVGGIVPKGPRILHQDGASLDHHTPGNPVSELQAVRSSRTSTSSPPLSILRTPGAPMTPIPGSDPECSSTRPQGQSLGSALSSRTRIKCRSSQQEDPETLLDLILESQGQRLNDQRASLSLLHDPGSGSLCGACNPNQLHRPSLDFYYMLINFQSDRMEDQRCPLPDLEDVTGSVPEDQEDFFSLIQRVQSRRMDEQRASLLTIHNEDDDDAHTCGSSSSHHRH